MTVDEFNIKYDTYLERRTYLNKYKELVEQKFDGLEFDIPEVTKYLDKVFEDLIKLPKFTYAQIKLKFGMARFYSTAPMQLNLEIERDINKIIKRL